MSMLYPHFKQFIAKEKLIEKNDTLLLSISGGIDSMVLMDLCARLRKPLGLTLVIAHINHGLRGRASNADERLVRERAEALGCPIEVLQKKPAASQNLQNAARTIRRRFLERVAQRHHAAIATAHHRDDQVETILMHLIRGAGVAGLSGMHPLAMQDGMRLIRPLLFASRSEIERYAHERSIAFRDDSTNAAKKYARNRVRHDLIPLLQAINPKAGEHIADTGRRLFDVRKTIETIAAEALECIRQDANTIDRIGFCAAPGGLRQAMLRLLFEQLAGSTADLAADHLERMDAIACTRQKASGTYRLPRRWQFVRKGDALVIRRMRSKCDR